MLSLFQMLFNLAVLLLGNFFRQSSNGCPIAISDVNLRFDCLPDVNVSKVGSTAAASLCTSRGCCWSPVDPALLHLSGPVQPRYPENRYPIHIGPPPCFHPTDAPPSYHFEKTVDATKAVDGGQQVTGQLKRNKQVFAPFLNNVDDVKIEVFPQSNNRLRIKISDNSRARYEVPFPVVSPPNEQLSSPNYGVKFGDKSGFVVWRKDTGETLFNATVGQFMFADQFIQLSAVLSSERLFGLSQSHDTFARSFDWQLCPLFASLLYPDYGSHPFYLATEKSGKSHGVFLFNSNAMDVILQPTPAITYRTIGGVLDFYFFLGPTPEEVIQQYTQLIGIPAMVPYWSLGFHLCKYGYDSLNVTKAVWSRNFEAGIPYDAQWNDIDYMGEGYKIFTYNNVTYDGLPGFINTLHQNNMRYVSIIDAGIAYVPGQGYGAVDRGLAQNIFIRNNSDGFANGKVWPDVCVFTDFSDNNSASYWTNEYDLFHQLLPYDGSWIDMNEVSTFSSGSIGGKCPRTTWDNPPYVPDVWGNNLAAATICMSSVLKLGIEYDLHSLYGFTMAINTHNALEKVLGQRPFVLSRSTAPGHGKYAAHWTGDVYSSWQDLQQVIPGILNMNMFGIPLVGSDICGFRENTTFELCQRWNQLGAFQPFARNHNDKTSIDQDPAAFGPPMISIVKNAFTIRYNLLPFMYTQFYRVNTKGGTVIRPLFFEFPDDGNTYLIQDQFLWGRSLMVFPILIEGATSVNPYFPKGLWYFWPNISPPLSSQGSRTQVQLSDPAMVSLAIRGGSIIPTQAANQTTDDSRKNKFGLLVALDDQQQAFGDLFWDDGITSDTVTKGLYSYITFNVSQNALQSTVEKYYRVTDSDFVLGNVTIMGVKQKPTNVLVQAISVTTFKYDAQTQCLYLSELSVPLSQDFSIRWNV